MAKTDSELLGDLKQDILNFMHAWDPCDNSSDYECRFCHARAKTNQGEITHADDCQAQKYYGLLDRMEEKLDRDAEVLGPG